MSELTSGRIGDSPPRLPQFHLLTLIKVVTYAAIVCSAVKAGEEPSAAVVAAFVAVLVIALGSRSRSAGFVAAVATGAAGIAAALAAAGIYHMPSQVVGGCVLGAIGSIFFIGDVRSSASTGADITAGKAIGPRPDARRMSLAALLIGPALAAFAFVLDFVFGTAHEDWTPRLFQILIIGTLVGAMIGLPILLVSGRGKDAENEE